MLTKDLIGRVAFWSYAQYPFLLWGTITDVKASLSGDLMVQIEGYGNHTFKPIHILTPERGQEAIAKLTEMHDEYHNKKRQLEAEWHEKLINLRSGYGLL